MHNVLNTWALEISSDGVRILKNGVRVDGPYSFSEIELAYDEFVRLSKMSVPSVLIEDELVYDEP